jgi:hypothetical protein
MARVMPAPVVHNPRTVRSTTVFILSAVLLASASATAEPPRVMDRSGPSSGSAPIDHLLCGTPDLLPNLAQRRLATDIPALLGPEKMVRDSFGGGFTQYLSPNFAVKWKDSTVTQANAKAVADALEAAWTKYITEFHHDPPTGATTYRINAYISRETDTPSIDFGGGYAWVDDQGYPYFVMSRSIFNRQDAAEALREVAVHEFYHDVQFGSGAYTWNTTQYRWYWEASAQWATLEAEAPKATPFRFAGPYALRSDLALYHYGDFRQDYLVGTHHYGASLFFRYVTHRFSDPQIVVKSWEQATATSEPIATVMSFTPASTSLGTVFAEFAAHNAVWDYADATALIASVNDFKALYPMEDNIDARVPSAGVPLTQLSRPIQALGYATIELARPSTGAFDLEVTMVQPAPDVQLYATVAHGAFGTASYTPLTVTGSKATGLIVFPDGVSTAYLSIAATTDARVELVSVPISYRATPATPPPPPPDQDDPDNDEPGGEDPGGGKPGKVDQTGDNAVVGACSASVPGPGWLAPLVLAIVLLGRRRRVVA